MSIHITIVQCIKPFESSITVIDKMFETTDEALDWWLTQDFQADNVLDVLKATRNEYVGTEHEIWNEDKTGYTNLFVLSRR